MRSSCVHQNCSLVGRVKKKSKKNNLFFLKTTKQTLVVFLCLSEAAKDSNRQLVESGFSVLSGVCDKHFIHVRENLFVELVSCFAAFAESRLVYSYELVHLLKFFSPPIKTKKNQTKQKKSFSDLRTFVCM
jgi:hypothetical protein